MSRTARKLSENGMYHIYFKGVSVIFPKDEDFEIFLSILNTLKDSMTLYAYGFSESDGHLFIKTDHISFVMKRLLTLYAMKFNKKYKRNGAIFESRYKSEPADELYATGLARYVMKGKKYSSLNDYIKGSGITDTGYIMSRFDSTEDFSKFMSQPEENTYGADKSENSAEIRLKIADALGGNNFLRLSHEQRSDIINKLSSFGISKSAMARYIGVSRATIMQSLHIQKKKKQDEIRRKNADMVLL